MQEIKRKKWHTHTHTHTESARVRNKPHSSSAQWHSSHSKCMLLINSIRSHRQRERLMERYSSVALEPHLSSVVSGCSSVLIYLLAPPQSTFYQVPLPFTVTVTSRSDNAEEEQSPQMWITYDNQNWLLTGNLFLFLYFFFFRAVNRYPLLHCSKGSVSILASVWCQSTRGKLPSACVSMCVCARARAWREDERERVRLSLCLALLWLSEPRLF